MNTIHSDIVSKAKDWGIKFIHGRKEQPQEYVEFDGGMFSHVKYVAQKSGDWWVVFRVMPGRNGTVETLQSFKSFDAAVNYALDACNVGK